ncbi:GDP-fucose transporter-like isoform X2 [Watersipora subatra]|uniref:GDP-fucose transporter-like isoform X2 n=1 Tax=Watersipora subatra TaxID=2589382 RepID=UPI00355BAC63
MLVPSYQTLSSGHFPQVCRVQYSLLLAKPVVIVSFLFSFMLSSNNYCLKLVGVAFFQIARSFTLIFTVIFSVTLLNMRASYMVILSCIIVVLGFLIGVDQEQAAGTLSVLGVISGLVSSLFVSLNGIYTKKAMKIDEMDSVKLMLHVNINSVVILFIPVVFSGQMAGVVEVGKLTESKFWFATCASGVLGFLIGWASTRQIDYTSPITHHVSNNTKSILQSLLAVWVYEDYKSALWWLGCFTVLLGAFMYTYVRIKEDGRKEKVIEVTNMPARSIHV